jgi:hypothetical protein
MRSICLSALLLIACDSTTNNVVNDLAMAAMPDLSKAAGNMDMQSAGPELTVNNTISWCTVTVTVPPAAAVMFGSSSMTFNAASGTTIALHAEPKPSFLAVKWTGVTTMNGADATYVMTSAATQSVTACCPLSNGTGC